MRWHLEAMLDAEVAGGNKWCGDIHYSSGDDNNYENAHSNDVRDNSVHEGDEQEASAAAAG